MNDSDETIELVVMGIDRGATKLSKDITDGLRGMADPFSAFLPFTKVSAQADGSIRVHSVINDETVDDQGEILDYAGTKAALDDFMKFANVREMHQPSAVGVVESITHDDLAKVTEGILHIVDPLAVIKVTSGVYKGTSVGGSKGPIREMEKVGGRKVTRLRQPYISELSLVDRPSRPTAVMTLLKRSDVAEEVPVSNDTTTAVTPSDEDAAKPTDAALEQAVEPAAEAETEAAPAVVAASPDAAAEPAAEAPVAAPEGAPADAPAPGASTAATAAEEPLQQAATIGDLSKASADAIEAAPTAKPEAAPVAGELAKGTTEPPVAPAGAEVEVPSTAFEALLPMYYTTVAGDLAKRAITLAKSFATTLSSDAWDPQLDTLISLAKSAGGRCDHDLVETPAGASSSIDITPETMAKFADAVFDRSSAGLLQKFTDAIGPLVRPDALEAMKGELLEALGPMKEELAKIAAQPAPGGALRFAPTERFGADGSMSPSTEAEVLAKAAAAVTDPAAKQAIGLLAATAQIRADQASAR